MPGYVPPPITGDDVFTLTYFQTLDSQRILTVLHFRFSDLLEPDYVTAMASLANALGIDATGATGWGGVRNFQSSDISYDFLRVQRVAESRDVYFSQTLGLNGGFVGAAAPPNVALVCNKRTVRVGKHGHGDLHLAAVPIGTVTDGIWNPVTVANVASAVGSFLLDPFDDAVTGNAIRFGIYDPTPVFGGLQDITDVVGYNQVRTMHRRTVGLGE
jgi:hypothetical protein